MVKKLLARLGLDAPVRRLRIAAGEGALAAEDRAQLLRMAWAEEMSRLRQLLLYAIAVIGLTTVVVALLSSAVVVHFWDTPHRVNAAWAVAGVWTLLWLAAIAGLWKVLQGASDSAVAARDEFERDWRWVQARIGARERSPGHRERRPVTREELLARIARQRERVAQLQAIPPKNSFPEARRDASLTDTMTRTVREHPVATVAVAAGALVVLGPKRIARWAAWLAPVVWRMRR